MPAPGPVHRGSDQGTDDCERRHREQEVEEDLLRAAGGSTSKNNDPASDIATSASPPIDSAWVTASRANGVDVDTERRGRPPHGELLIRYGGVPVLGRRVGARPVDEGRLESPRHATSRPRGPDPRAAGVGNPGYRCPTRPPLGAAYL